MYVRFFIIFLFNFLKIYSFLEYKKFLFIFIRKSDTKQLRELSLFVIMVFKSQHKLAVDNLLFFCSMGII